MKKQIKKNSSKPLSKKSKTQKIIYRTLKIMWGIIGILILFWTSFWYIKVLTIGELGGVIAGTILFALGFYLLGIYIGITLFFLLIKWIIKKLR